jgi:hypothetical protein
MADKDKSVKIRETKEAIFDILKSIAPALFGSKVFADVARFGEDENDQSKIIIEFKEETDS